MQLAQLNIARMIKPLGHPLMKDFEANLDLINALAEASPGFVWRFQEDNNNADTLTIFDDDYWLINMSVWQSIKDLSNFVYKSGHMEFFRRRQEWFEITREVTTVMWYVLASEYPTVDHAEERLMHLRKHGDTPFAFSFKKRFTIEDLQQWQGK